MKFWDHQKFPKAISLTVERIFNIVEKVQKRIFIFSLIAFTLYLVPPVFNEDIVSVIEMWTFPNSLGLNAALLAVQYMYYCVAAPIVLGYDLVYISLLVDVVTQIKLLKFRLKSVTFDSKDEAVKVVFSCIQHHQFLHS